VDTYDWVGGLDGLSTRNGGDAGAGGGLIEAGVEGGEGFEVGLELLREGGIEVVPASPSTGCGIRRCCIAHPDDQRVSFPTSGVTSNLRIVVPGGWTSYVTSEWNSSAREKAYKSGREFLSE
jgi:hypothetical protein